MEPQSLVSQLEPEKLGLKLMHNDAKKVIPGRKPNSSFLNPTLFSRDAPNVRQLKLFGRKWQKKLNKKKTFGVRPNK